MAAKNKPAPEHQSVEQKPKNPIPASFRPFQKGVSGNPGGRPKGRSLLAELRACLDETSLLDKPNPGGKTNRRLLAEMAIRHALAGKSVYFREIMNRIHGRVPLRVDANVVSDPVSELPDSVIDAMMEAGMAAANAYNGADES